MTLAHLGALNPLKNLGLPEILRAPNMLEILFQMIYTMEYEIAQTRLDPVHVVIEPEVSNFSWTELHRAKEIIATGERAAEEAAPKIKALLPYYADYCKLPLTPTKWKDY
jgi:predicted acylesterase/phospholipase RssA